MNPATLFHMRQVFLLVLAAVVIVLCRIFIKDED
jgi:hypothetical protein